MLLQSRLNEDLKKALKAGDGNRAGVLRFLLAQIHNREIEKKGKTGESSLGEEEVIEVLQKEVKKRKEAAELFWKGNREDLASKEEMELKIVGEYLPPPLTREEIEAVVKTVVEQGFGDFNSVMRESMKILKGKVDGKTLAEIIREKQK